MAAPKLEQTTVEVDSTPEALINGPQGIEHLRLAVRAVAGSIRQLESAVERVILFSPGDTTDDGTIAFATIGPADTVGQAAARCHVDTVENHEDAAEDEVATIGFHAAALQLGAARMASGGHSVPDGRWLTAAEVEREHIVRTLEVAHDNQSTTAKLLDIDRHQLRRRMQEHGLLTPGNARRGRPPSAIPARRRAA